MWLKNISIASFISGIFIGWKHLGWESSSLTWYEATLAMPIHWGYLTTRLDRPDRLSKILALVAVTGQLSNGVDSCWAKVNLAGFFLLFSFSFLLPVVAWNHKNCDEMKETHMEFTSSVHHSYRKILRWKILTIWAISPITFFATIATIATITTIALASCKQQITLWVKIHIYI